MTHTTEPHGRDTGSLESRHSGNGDASPDSAVSAGESIQSTLESASTGDVIELAPGTSTEQVVIATDDAQSDLRWEPHSITASPFHLRPSVRSSNDTWGPASNQPEPEKIDTT